MTASPPARNDMSQEPIQIKFGHYNGRKNTTQVFVVMYPSNSTSTALVADTKKTPDSYGFGICVQPKKRTKAKFWTEGGSEPVLFTVEDYGEDGLTMRSGCGIGEENMALRIQVAEKDDFVEISQLEDCLTPLVEGGRRRADLDWILDCLQRLQDKNVILPFDLVAFTLYLQSVIHEHDFWSERKQDAALTTNYLDYIEKGGHLKARRASLGQIVLEKLRKTSSPKEVENVLRLN